MPRASRFWKREDPRNEFADIQTNGLYKTLSNTNLAASRHIKREKAHFWLTLRRSKTPLLKPPNEIGRWTWVNLHIHSPKVMTATFQDETPQFSIAFLSLILLGRFSHEETFKVWFYATRQKETSLFQKRSVPRVFAFCSFNCFRNNLGTHNKGTLFAQ